MLAGGRWRRSGSARCGGPAALRLRPRLRAQVICPLGQGFCVPRRSCICAGLCREAAMQQAAQCCHSRAALWRCLARVLVITCGGEHDARVRLAGAEGLAEGPAAVVQCRCALGRLKGSERCVRLVLCAALRLVRACGRCSGTAKAVQATLAACACHTQHLHCRGRRALCAPLLDCAGTVACAT